MPSADHIRSVVERYPELAAKGDVDAIVDLYAEDATIEDPIGSDLHEGRDAIRAFYQASAGTFTMKRAGKIHVAANESATPLVIVLGEGADAKALDVVSVLRFDDDGKIASMRAFWSFEDMRPATDADR